MATVRVLRPFANEHPDRITHPGEIIEVNDARALDLAGNGLVEPFVAVKAEVQPVNKMAPAPATKVVASPVKAPAGRFGGNTRRS